MLIKTHPLNKVTYNYSYCPFSVSEAKSLLDLFDWHACVLYNKQNALYHNVSVLKAGVNPNLCLWLQNSYGAIRHCLLSLFYADINDCEEPISVL